MLDVDIAVAGHVLGMHFDMNAERLLVTMSQEIVLQGHRDVEILDVRRREVLSNKLQTELPEGVDWNT